MAKKTAEVDDRTVTKDELKQIDRANSAGKQPVVFVHGLWLLPSSWDRWAKVFESAGYTAVRPGWPDDPDTVEQAKEHPDVFARKSVGQIADHFEAVDQEARPQAGGGRSQLRRAAHADPRRPRRVGSVGGDRSGTVPGRAAAPDLRAAVGVAGVAQPCQPPPRRSAHVRAVPLRLRQRARGGRGQVAVREVRGAGIGRADLPSRGREPEPVDRSQGRQQEPRSRSLVDHRRASSTTPCRGRSRTRRTSERSATPARPRSSR